MSISDSGAAQPPSHIQRVEQEAEVASQTTQTSVLGTQGKDGLARAKDEVPTEKISSGASTLGPKKEPNVLEVRMSNSSDPVAEETRPIDPVGTKFRLPNHVRPERYEVYAELDLEKEEFRASVKIHAEVSAASDTVQLHAADMKLAETVTAVIGNEAMIGTVTYDAETERATFKFDRPLPEGKVIFDLDYTGTVQKDLKGLYLADDKSGNRALVTQAEPSDARKFVPSFDEPEYKARIQWTLRVPKGYTAYTNGPERKRTEEPDGTVTFVFDETEKISSYLFALVVGKFEESPVEMVGRGKNIPARMITSPGRLDQADYAMQVTRAAVRWYEEHFDHDFPFKKLDQIAVPAFAAGAMENVGLVTNRPEALLIDRRQASWNQLRRVAEVPAHEIAHMWFGNLVTMLWWDDLWLNEAFATWASHKAVDAWDPSLKMWDSAISGKESAMSDDALVNTHPIYVKVDTSAQAEENFDSITYEKGSAMLRMIELAVGEKEFRDGVRHYIRDFAGKNAESADLWSRISKASKLPVDAIMESWVKQPGYPSVAVEMKKEGGQTRVRLSQKRFFENPENDATNDQTWMIPLTLRYFDGTSIKTKTIVLKDQEEELLLPGSVEWAYPNGHGSGFFRSQVDPGTLEAFQHGALAQLSPHERRGLIRDQWALVKRGEVDIVAFVELLKGFASERDYLVVEAMVSALGGMMHLAKDEDREKLGALAEELLRPQLQELGWEPAADESPENGSRRATVISALGRIAKSPDVLAKAKELAAIEKENPEAIDGDLAPVVVALAAQQGDSTTLESYLQEYQKRAREGATPQAQSRYLGALSSFSTGVERLLDASLSEIPKNQTWRVIVGLLHNRDAQSKTWDYVRKNWKKIEDYIGSGVVKRIISAMAALPGSEYDAVVEFLDAHPIEEAKRAAAQTKERLRAKKRFYEIQGPKLASYLRTHGTY